MSLRIQGIKGGEFWGIVVVSWPVAYSRVLGVADSWMGSKVKRVLVVHYSQTGQLNDVLSATLDPLVCSPDVDVVFECLKPVEPYPFPWPFLTFFDAFPETVFDKPSPIAPLSVQEDADFDLVILAYQVWFLSPSQPITAFLQTREARTLLKGKPVITLIACRNMWLMAQEKMKENLAGLGASLIDNVVVTDPSHSAATFYSTPVWLLTGNKGPYWFGLIPKAGIQPEQLVDLNRFGRAMLAKLPKREKTDFSPMLEGLGAVKINHRLIASERVALRSFRLWGRLLQACGAPGARLRKIVLLFYFTFLLTLILTVVPVTAVIKWLLTPLMRDRIKAQCAYYAAPSGESTEFLEKYK